ncbi:MAG: linear amide C-N hydrolase [Bacteroidetes bacterium]|nr:linear amide C-N hydrolase [Bacteroidota bacterium]
MIRIYTAIIIVLFFAFPGGIVAQVSLDYDKLFMDAGTDIIMKDNISVISVRSWYSTPPDDARIVFCPAGIERSSPNDVKKRCPFEWTVKYDNIYVEVLNGIVIEGMNKHGLSASLMFLKNSRLPKKEKTLIPIAASLWTRFYLDHFKCIDTAMLAVWDIRLFDDLNSKCGWPFRLVLHDSTGATAFIEYIDGKLRVYDPGPPAVITDGPDYASLLIEKYIPTGVSPESPAARFIRLEDTLMKYRYPINIVSVLEILEYPGTNTPKASWFLARDHREATLQFLSEDKRDIRYKLDEVNFTPGKEIRQKLFP